MFGAMRLGVEEARDALGEQKLPKRSFTDDVLAGLLFNALTWSIAGVAGQIADRLRNPGGDKGAGWGVWSADAFKEAIKGSAKNAIAGAASAKLGGAELEEKVPTLEERAKPLAKQPFNVFFGEQRLAVHRLNEEIAQRVEDLKAELRSMEPARIAGLREEIVAVARAWTDDIRILQSHKTAIAWSNFKAQWFAGPGDGPADIDVSSKGLDAGVDGNSPGFVIPGMLDITLVFERGRFDREPTVRVRLGDGEARLKDMLKEHPTRYRIGSLEMNKMIRLEAYDVFDLADTRVIVTPSGAVAPRITELGARLWKLFVGKQRGPYLKDDLGGIDRDRLLREITPDSSAAVQGAREILERVSDLTLESLE